MKRIHLSHGDFTLVDDVDFLYLVGYNWSVNGHGYVQARIDGKVQKMHRIIIKRMELDIKDKVVDHKDCNTLNNCRSNLRVATRSQNQANQSKQKSNTSGFKGVAWDKDRKMWRASISVNNRMNYLGLFNTPEEAHQAYVAAAKQFYGEFAHH